MVFGKSVKNIQNKLSNKFHDLFLNFDKYKPNQYSKSIYYKFYINSYKTGKYTLEITEKIIRIAKNFWYYTLSELYVDLSNKLRKTLEYKQSGIGRGEFSITKMLINFGLNITYIFSETGKSFKKNPLYGFRTFGSLILSSIKSLWINGRKYFNYIAPIAGVVAIILAISFWSKNNFALAVTYNGNQLGYVQSEQDFRTAVTNVEQSVKTDTGNSFQLNYKPTFKLVIVNTSNYEDAKKLSKSIINLSSNQLIQGYGMYVDSKLIGVNIDEVALKKTLTNLLDSFRKNTPGENVAFVQNVVVKAGLYPSGITKSIDDINKIITSNVQQQQTYTTIQGDSPSAISTKLQISLSKLYYLNPTLQSSKVKVGQSVIVESSRSYLGVKVIANETYTQDIPFNIQNVSNNQIYKSQTQIATQGVKGQAQVNAAVTYIDGVSVDKLVISQTVIKSPIDQIVYIGTKPKPSTVASGIFAWPIPKGIGYVSCPFGGYRGHSGMDIACNQGTPILAADAGTVRFAGWNSGYGYCVQIQHGNGFVTLYGHSSKLLVTAGTQVFKGQVIALVGHTGNVSGRTGNHVHFEVQKNGNAVNPASFLQAR
jgi:murein DD-endopeptidase MepM/ murein hydrolase activator NlpD